MTVLEQGQIQIHTENIFPIIKKAVYSGHEVFLRELVSNGVDAISKRRMAAMAGDCSEGEEGKIQIRIDRENKTVTISDNGIGMSRDEVKRYINQVAFSSAEEFLEKYKREDDAIIGHFGLGFYSSFMVAAKVELVSLSARPEAEAVRWSCDGSPNFSLEEGERDTPGTDIILHMQEEELEYIEPARIRALITTYCDFLPVEVQLEGETVNKRQAPWRQSARDLTDKDYIELYRYLYPFQGDPLLWVHLSTDYPYNLQGILYFPKLTGRGDWEKGEIRLYCNQVFVSDSIKEVVPRYLLPLRGVIDSPDIPLNVSRSALQTDRRVRSIGGFVAKKVGDRLKQLHRDEPERYNEIWEGIAPFIKIGAMEDEKFAEQVADLVLFGTTAESAFTTLADYRSRLPADNDKRVLYCTDEAGQAGPLALWKGQGAEVLLADSLIDAQFIPWLEARHEDLTFRRVDAELDESLQEEDSGITDAEGKDSSEQLRSLFKEALANDKVTLQVQALKGESAPAALILLPEQMRRLNDMGALMEQRLPGLPDHHVLLINRRHPLVEGVLKLSSGAVITGGGTSPTRQLADELTRHIYEMARLSVGGLEPQELAGFQQRSADLMGRLMQRGF
ncbi:molecular chaperone HtpG [Synechococcus sp. CS-602]|uniref:molecular chaperone HtpG n=1 Tax=Synechococcaceae TaxID=1890426 RepID=UPI0008FF782A|nr:MULTISPECIES: molecular chaperone HtpG [Synechococcaceae]MCT4364277.1 molecular chaperone HtpG [Candidatus Regnicoccus frigidus MAG-AL1]APD48914.1 molecular chaperone HtpG [Synechococcus sp. SynAce01]MCT0203725.1 molecular chaperone HtpG [Synechococcus sp. CS-602]MCT0246414.1 molecular chaperone HtpG [Synechococcus sp. CS-601]MCT4367077.1 molecular chaperone HtpG [Candidatus Regnicoccus frigidus MAG-AL2]